VLLKIVPIAGYDMYTGENWPMTAKESQNRNSDTAFRTMSDVACGWDVAEWLECLTASAEVATVMGSIPASSDTVESERRQMKQCWISYIKNRLLKFVFLFFGVQLALSL
jgi:hypothetical protein